MEEQEYQELIERFLHDEPLSPAEMQQLLNYLRAHNEQPALQQTLQQALAENTFGQLADTVQADSIFENIQAKIKVSQTDFKSHNTRNYFLRIAASIALILGISLTGYYFYRKGNSGHENIAVSQAETQKIIRPGSDKAYLKLANGDSILLDNAGTRTLASQGSTQIVQQGGQLAYKTGATTQAGAPVYNTLAIPRGGKFQLVLPDGSKVWLNSATSLRFPTAFVGEERRVELTGEAYFEVAKNKAQPFIVEANGMEVKVLGTHFNVASYSDEDAIKTTLLEGSVQVQKEGKQVLLTPGEQSALHKTTGKLQVAKVNTEEVVAWKNELFVFKNADIKSVMRQLSRWYDVDVAYKGNVETHLNGMISRNTNLPDLLKLLELSGEAHFNINGQEITVSETPVKK